jgi:predicted acyl esterase
LFQQEKFIFVYQDVRGKLMSEGEFVEVRPHNPKKTSSKDIDESTDTFDTIEWLVKNAPNNNGRAGMWGISYPGFYTSMGLLHRGKPARLTSSGEQIQLQAVK